jgi:Na+/H+ antiporter NhaC
MNKNSRHRKMLDFLHGIGHEDIICMCIIFLLAGAFGEVTKSIDSVDSMINLALSFISAEFLPIGIFCISALLATAIGSAIGTIAAVGPIAAELVLHAQGLPVALSMGAVVGGAMFGDNLSIVSDTTIAAISSQGADLQKKLRLNIQFALVAGLITIAILWNSASVSSIVKNGDYSLILILPYALLVILALNHVHVFTCLVAGIAMAGIIGCAMKENYDIISLSNSINVGFRNVNGIMLLSLLIGGLSGLIGNDAIGDTTRAISAWISKKSRLSKLPQFIIAGVASVFTVLLANNVIAIIFAGKIAKGIAKNHGISSHYSATLLDIFACAVKGLLPYGAQVLLAASIAEISPLSIAPYVHYCYVMLVVGIVFIMLKKNEISEKNSPR